MSALVATKDEYWTVFFDENGRDINRVYTSTEEDARAGFNQSVYRDYLPDMVKSIVLYRRQKSVVGDYWFVLRETNVDDKTGTLRSLFWTKAGRATEAPFNTRIVVSNPTLTVKGEPKAPQDVRLTYGNNPAFNWNTFTLRLWKRGDDAGSIVLNDFPEAEDAMTHGVHEMLKDPAIMIAAVYKRADNKPLAFQLRDASFQNFIDALKNDGNSGEDQSG